MGFINAGDAKTEHFNMKWKSLMLAIVMVVSLIGIPGPVSADGTESSQINDELTGHWAEAVMRQWINAGLLKGYSDGTYRPNGELSRGELITLINRAFQLDKRETPPFSDVAESNWIYEDIGIAFAEGYLKGYEDGTVQWQRYISREEAAVMIAEVLKANQSDTAVLETFIDYRTISNWSKSAAAALAEAGIMVGFPDGTFQPSRTLTRAEAVTLLEKSVQYKSGSKTITFEEAGVYGPETEKQVLKGDVVIKAPGITLRNTIIEGDLLLDKAVGEGDAHFKNV